MSPIINRVIIIVLISVVVILGGQYYSLYKDLQTQKSLNQIYQYNGKMLNFAKLFIAKVIMAQGDVSFEDRLKLENAVRNINDETVFEQWQRFIEAETESQVGENAKILLELLVNKITY
ncbi:hypothetical protein KKG36_02395 [Patescibacteria group bacterium]|nr:hypothetical protein [Patescibacteria group bacterium]